MIKEIKEKLKHMKGKTDSRKVLIVGTGRSGTHWIAYILKEHPKIKATIERDPGFKWVKQMAVDPSTKKTLYKKLVYYYWWNHIKSVPRHYVDKSHPALWVIDELINTFNDLLVLGVERNPYATIASMLQHKGVKKWFGQWKKYPLPNKFLGITKKDVDKYESYSIVKKCAKRWKSHHEKMKTIKNKYDNVCVINHEELVYETSEVTKRMRDFIGLESQLRVSNIDYRTIDKWKKELTHKDIKEIYDVTGVKKGSWL